MRHSKTTEALIHSIQKIKSQKQLITNKLSNSIIKNHQYFDDHSANANKYNLKTHIDRERSIDLLSKKLMHKKKMDEYSDVKLVQIQKQNLKKKYELERRLEQINNRNAKRIQELKDLEENVLKKIHEDIQKNENRERHLQREYHRIRSEQKKVSQTRLMQTNESDRQWKALQNQKIKLQFLAKKQEQNQSKLISEKNPVMIKREDKRISELKKISKVEEYSKFKSVNRLDSKEMGNQYLEQVKLMQRQYISRLRKQNQKNLMDINMKVIGYTSDMMERIFRNTSNLSQADRDTSVAKTTQETTKLKGKGHQQVAKLKDEALQQTKQIKSSQPLIQIEPSPVTINNSLFRMPVDYETQKYLRQIKINLKSLQNIHEKVINPESNVSKEEQGASSYRGSNIQRSK